MVSTLWTHRLGATGGGLAFAAETGQVLAWDAHPWLVLLNHRGHLQGQLRLNAPVVAGAIAVDGSALAVADDRGQVAWLGRDLTVRWRKRLTQRPTAVALDPLGRVLAAADAAGRLHLLDSSGNALRPPVETVRPVVHLFFAAARAAVVAAADFGLVGELDPFGRWLWQDVPVVHLGGLACSGDGRVVAVSCFSEGVRRYDPAGRPLPAVPTPEPCRLVSSNYAGNKWLTAGVFGGVHGLDAAGNVRAEERYDQPIIGLGLTPLGDRSVVALADGRVTAIDLGDALAG
jgi:hypothetical protein